MRNLPLLISDASITAVGLELAKKRRVNYLKKKNSWAEFLANERGFIFSKSVC